MKSCSVCKQLLPLTSYYRYKLSKDGFGYRCKECDVKARHAYREANKERFKQVSRNKSIKFKYGITQEQYLEILSTQNNTCAICECGVDSPNVNGSFAIDHCHTTGQIRGLLCNQCNRGLGMLGDTISSIEKALAYLKKPING